MNPIAMVAIGCTAIGGYLAWTVQEWRIDGIEAKQAAAMQQVRDQQRADADAASAAHEAEREAIRAQVAATIKEVPRVIEKPVYRNVCFDTDGLRLVRAAIGAAGHPGEPASTVPGADSPR